MFQANHSFGSYHRFVKHVAQETFHEFHTLNDGSIPEKVYKKIQWYMVESIFMGEILANLTDHSINKKDKEGLIYLGAVMALFDAMIDDLKLEKTVVIEIFENTFLPDHRIGASTKTTIDKVYFLFLDKLVNTIGSKKWLQIKEYLNNIKFQLQSEQQMSEEITEESVIKITMGKGGVIVLLCSAILFPAGDPLKKTMYELGGFIQMMNDCQDIYKDTIGGIHTFVHFSKDFRDIFDKLDEQRKIVFHELKSLDYSYHGRKETLFIINAMFIVISYKLQKYAEVCNYHLDFKFIASMDKKDFRINPFSPCTIAHCSAKILRFKYETCESTPDFKFENGLA